MIQSILDNDLYKFTMQQAVLRLYPDAQAVYAFTNRGKTPFPKGLCELVEEKVGQMVDFCLTPDQRTWLETHCPYFDSAYLDYLQTYRYTPGEICLSQKNGRLDIEIKGPWHSTILWEVPLMAMVSELYFKLTQPNTLDRDQIRQRNQDKATQMAHNQVSFVDFGTRRRFSSANHRHLIDDIIALDTHTMAGTSNVHLAMTHDLVPVGTMAHEWIMFHSATGPYETVNQRAMAAWTQVYPDVLGIALPDTYTTPVFLRTFDKAMADRLQGIRQDSGDPVEFARNIIRHYQSLGIDPVTKTLVFSDSLTPQRAIDIHTACKGQIKDTYGIGTNLTNDIGPAPLNIVIKLAQCRPDADAPWKKTVKLSDDKGKHTGDIEELARCLKAIAPFERQ